MKEENSFKNIFSNNINGLVDVKSIGITSRSGRIVMAFNNFVLIDFEHLSTFRPGGLFYVCYTQIVDFQVLKPGKPK